jgi:hypothetical protein
MAIFLARFASTVGIAVPSAPPSAGFVDISGLDATIQVAINQLAALGITNGTSATEFSPNIEVPRWQMAIFLTRVLQADGVVPT